MVGHEDPRNPYPSRNDARINIPPETFPHQQVRGTIPDVDMRPLLDLTPQKYGDMALLVSQLASEVLLLKSNSMPPATIADNYRLSPFTPGAVSPPAVVAAPLPTPPAVPTGEPLLYESGARPKRHPVKLENYAGQRASFEAFLAKYEEHLRYYRWNDDDRVFHPKNCLIGTAAIIFWAGTQLIALLKNQNGTENQLELFWLELYGRKGKLNESLHDLYQDIRRLISLTYPNDVSDTFEGLAINQFTNALDIKNLRFEVLNKNSTTLEKALHIAMRYEALKPSHSASQGANDKGQRKKVCEHTKYTYYPTQTWTLNTRLSAQEKMKVNER